MNEPRPQTHFDAFKTHLVDVVYVQRKSLL